MREPSKKRFLQAVNHTESDEISLFEMQADMAIVNRVLDTNFPLSLMSYELPISDYVELNHRIGNDVIYFGHIWRLGRKETKDAEGRIHYVGGSMKTPESLKNIWYPDLGVLQRRIEELFRTVEGTGFGVICGLQPPPWVVTMAMGLEDYWVNAAENPKFVYDFTNRIQDWAWKEQELYMKYPIVGFVIAFTFLTGRGPMCSPEMFERFGLRYIRQQARSAKEKNKIVFLYAGGNFTNMMPLFIEMEADVIGPIEPCGGAQDIYLIKQIYGDKISLCGNIDVNGVLVNGKPQDVRCDVIQHINRLARGGGYIVAPSQDIHQLIPLENLYAMRDAVHEYRFKGKSGKS